MQREAVAGQVDHVDVGGAGSNAILQYARTFVHQCVDATRDDLFITDLARRDAQFLAILFQHLLDFRIGQRLAVARLVEVPALAGLLAVAAKFAKTVGKFRIADRGLFDIAALADGPADVVAGQIAHAERAHGHAPFLHGLVDLRRRGAFFQQKSGNAAVVLDHAIADEAVADAGDHGRFLDFLRHLHHRRHDILGGRRAAHHFEQLHDIGRAEEVHADHVLRTFGEIGDLVHVERRGVGGQYCAGLGDLVEFLEHGLLDADFLEYRLDDQVGILEIVIGHRALQHAHALVQFFLGQLALLHAVFVVLADRGHALVQRFLLHFEHRHRNSRIQEVHGDAAAHGAGADHADLGDLARRGVVGHVGNFRRRALAGEGVTQGA